MGQPMIPDTDWGRPLIVDSNGLIQVSLVSIILKLPLIGILNCYLF
jgi:hypothetical protein